MVAAAPRLLPLLTPACETTNGRCTAWDVIENCIRRTQQIWVAEASGEVIGIAVTRLVDYPGGRACQMNIGTTEGGTTPQRWRKAMTELMDWARGQGCTLFELHCRAGWERVFAGTLEKTHIFLEARL